MSSTNRQRSSQTGSAQSPARTSRGLKCTRPIDLVSFPDPQVLFYSSLHLTRAVLSRLSEDDGQLIKELWRAVAWFREVDHFSISAEICRLLFRDGVPGPRH